MFRHATVSQELSTVNNISKSTALTYFSFSERIEKVPCFYILLLCHTAGSTKPEKS